MGLVELCDRYIYSPTMEFSCMGLSKMCSFDITGLWL